jgi:hypothetical protein
VIRINIIVEDYDSISAAGYTQIQVFTDTSSTGTFGTSDGTMSLVSQQTGYVYIDTDGTTGTYYKTAYYGAGTGSSALSDAIQGGITLYYADALDVRREMASGASDDAAIGTHDDVILYNMCEEATRMIDAEKGVDPGAYIADTSTSQRYYSGSGDDFQTIDYATSLDEVAVEETDGTYTAWTEDTDFYAWPYNYSSIGEPIQALEVSRKSGSSKSVFNVGPRRVRVAASWGVSSSVPPNIRRIASIQVARWYKRAQQGWQDTAANVELGELTFTAELDPEVKRILAYAFPTKKAGI